MPIQKSVSVAKSITGAKMDMTCPLLQHLKIVLAESHPKKPDLRTVIIKTAKQLRRSQQPVSTENWIAWWETLSKHQLEFQNSGGNSPTHRLTPRNWRGWVKLPDTMPMALRSLIAEKALATYAPQVHTLEQVRTAWRWALPFANDNILAKTSVLTVQQQMLWGSLVAINQARKGDYGLLRKIWIEHEPGLGLILANLALIHLPRSSDVNDLLQDLTYFRERPTFTGGATLAMEVVFRLHACGLLPNNPPPVWFQWCSTYLGHDLRSPSLERAFESAGIPWNWKFEALIAAAKAHPKARTAIPSQNLSVRISPQVQAPLEDRLNLVHTVFTHVYSSRQAHDIEQTRTEELATWATGWVPENTVLFKMWAALELDMGHVLHALANPQNQASGAIPLDVDISGVYPECN